MDLDGNNISYLQQLNTELEEKLSLEDLLSEISANFINAPWNQIYEQMKEALIKIAKHFKFDRCSISEINETGDDFRIIFQYTGPGIPNINPPSLREVFPWMISQILQNKVVEYTSPMELPSEAKLEQEYIRNVGLKSSLQLPLVIGDSLAGVLSFGSFQENYTPVNILGKFRTLVSDTFGNALARRKREKEIEVLREEVKEKLQFEKIISGLSSKFIHLPWREIDTEIENSLKDIVEFLRFERGNILEINEAGDDVIITHQYPGPATRATGFKDIVPWYIRQMIKGETIIISSPDDFPPEAVEEREQSRHTVFQSTVTLPLKSGNNVIGALGFTTYSFGVSWNDDIINRLKFVSSIYANALARKKTEEKLEKYHEMVAAENIILKNELMNEYDFQNIIGSSDAIKYVFYKIKQISSSDISVLIEGETGVGKQLFAYAIHQMSKRKDIPLLKVNCAALPTNLIESELFGHEKGAFTGADKTVKGRFEIADGGTIFLDEIGELPLELQAKLLRVLQDGEFERLGSTKTIKTDVRIIAATNRRLKEEVNEGKFRKDLYYRLSAYPITIPPLRERKEDISLLVNYLAKKIAAKINKKVVSIHKSTMEKLINYSWPGNVRELENVMERAIVTMKGTILEITDELDSQEEKHFQVTTLEEMERSYIIKVLEMTEGKIYGEGGAAEVLGMNPSTLRARIKKLNISSKKIIS